MAIYVVTSDIVTCTSRFLSKAILRYVRFTVQVSCLSCSKSPLIEITTSGLLANGLNQTLLQPDSARSQHSRHDAIVGGERKFPGHRVGKRREETITTGTGIPQGNIVTVGRCRVTRSASDTPRLQPGDTWARPQNWPQCSPYGPWLTTAPGWMCSLHS